VARSVENPRPLTVKALAKIHFRIVMIILQLPGVMVWVDQTI
jgi:hypothetical protein